MSSDLNPGSLIPKAAMSTVEMTSQERWPLRWIWKIRQDLDIGRLLVVGRGGYEDKGQLLGRGRP